MPVDTHESPIFLVTAFIAAVLIIVMFAISAMMPKTASPTAQTAIPPLTPLEEPTVQFGNPTIGPKTAAVTIVVFSDYLCPACAVANDVLKQLITEFPQEVRLVWKDFPNGAAHPGAVEAAVAARCAGYQNAFWKFHDLLFATPGLASTATNFPALAGQAGIGLDDFNNCVQQNLAKPLVERDVEEGQRLGLDGTPYLFVNKRRISGLPTYESLQKTVLSEIAHGGEPSATEPVVSP